MRIATSFFSRHTRKLSSAIALATLSLGGYYMAPATAAPPATPPPPKVETLEVQPQNIRSWAEYSGRLSPVESATIKPQISGTIEKVLFTEGQQVTQGQALFVIDPRPYQAAFNRAKAQLASANSQAKLALDEFNRSEKLFKDKLVSDSIHEAAINNYQVAVAHVQEAQAALNQSQLNVDYAHIKAPIAGRIGRAELTQGNVVESGPNAPALTKIVANDKLYAEFNVDEATYINLVRNTPNIQEMPVELSLASATAVKYPGHMVAFDNQLDSASGTIRARAILDNRDGALTAGMFAHVRMGSATTNAALLIPDRAIGTNQSKKFVMVVDANNIATYREINLGEHYLGQRLVLAGLTAGDKIIVNGLSHVRPNSQVNPSPVAGKTAEENKVAANP